MSTEALSLLQSRLNRLKAEHLGRLLEASRAALDSFNPTRKATFSASIDMYMQGTCTEQASYCARVRQEVNALVEELLLPLAEATKMQVLSICEHSFDEAMYPQRFDLQLEAIDRKGSRQGAKVMDWGIRTDIQRAQHQVATSNAVRNGLSTLAEELELVRIRSARKGAASLSTPGDARMPFADLMNDTIDILKTNGDKIEGLRASVQRNQIFMTANTVVIEPNDLIVRRMSNGAEETYRVIDPGFHETFHSIKAHYQMEVQKLGLPEARSAVQHLTVNIHGDNARFNQNSVDNSTNIVHMDARAMQQIHLLREEVEKADLPLAEKQAALEVVDEVEGAFRAGKPKKSVVSALLSALPHAGNIASIVSAIVSLF